MSREKVDLTPDPRVLPTLGEVGLNHWQCLAEFIDNSVDGFLSDKNKGGDIRKPTIKIILPTKKNEEGEVYILDNGPGMSKEQLRKAVRAGYSNRDSGGFPDGGFLGIWGMGMNIASARLGEKMEVISVTSSNACGITLDLPEMVNQGKFEGEIWTPKANEYKKIKEIGNTGTMVRIKALKPDHHEIMIQPKNRKEFRNKLGRIYSTMLTSHDPISLRININGQNIIGHKHFYWSSEDAEKVATRLNKPVKNIYIEINKKTERGTIRGWLGVQRYADESEYGIDLVRNGRIIEIGNKKDVFYYDQDGEMKKEYPIDDFGINRGRIIGEIHMNHCGVPHTKHEFDRTDPAWNEMLAAVRWGRDYPIGKDKSEKIKGKKNNSPLARIYSNYRRNTPQSKNVSNIAEIWLSMLSFPGNLEEQKQLKEKAKNEDIADDKWLPLLEKSIKHHTGSKKIDDAPKKTDENTTTVSKTKSKNRSGSIVQIYFPEILDGINDVDSPYLKHIVEELNLMDVKKTPISCCFCLRAAMESALKWRISKSPYGKKIVNPKENIEQAPGLGTLLRKIEGFYKEEKKTLFPDATNLDSVIKSFINIYFDDIHDAINNIIHGKIAPSENRVKGFAIEFSQALTGLICERIEK